MSLMRVYHDLPDGSLTPYSPWYRTKQGSGGAEDVPLDLYGAGGLLYWRGVYSSDDWKDNNHVGPDGIGWVSLMAVAQNGARGGASGVIGDREYNLIGAEFRFAVGLVSSSLRLGQKTRLVPWFQFRVPTANQCAGCYVNVAPRISIDQLLGFTPAFERAGPETKSTPDFRTVVVRFDPSKPWEWMEYGTSVEDAEKYGRPNSLYELFSRWDLNCGIHAFYGQASPASGDLPFGHLNIRELSLWVDPALNPDARVV